MRVAHALLLTLPCSFAANQPTFTYTPPAGATVAAIAIDAAGNTYLTGTTSSSTFPATPGALQTQFAGGTCSTFVIDPSGGEKGEDPCTDAFVIKLDPTGAVVFATYLGGEGSITGASAIAVDAGGNIYVGGGTTPGMNVPDTFPVTPGAAFTSPATGGGFVSKLNPSGSQLVYSTFVPTLGAVALAIDLNGNAYIIGQGGSAFQATPGAFQAAAENRAMPGIVAELNPAGSALVYATYLSGNNIDALAGIAVDTAGDAFISGHTESPSFPVTAGAYEATFPGSGAGFVTKLNPLGTGIIYSTFIGIGSDGGLSAIKVDSQGGAYVLGYSQLVLGTSQESFLAHLSADGSSLIYGIFLPIPTDSNLPAAAWLDLDSAGDAFVTGEVGNPNCGDRLCNPGLPAMPGAFQPNGDGGPCLEKFTPDGQLAGATYLPGAIPAGGRILLAVAPNGSVVIPTYSSPVSPNTVIENIFPSLTVLNTASSAATSVAPGEIVTLRGYGIGPATGAAAPNSVPTTLLGGVQVFFDQFPAPLFYTQAQQINAQVPWEIAGETSTQVTILYPGVPASPVPVAVAPASPGIFYINNSDGTQNSAANPAKAGDFISIYGTGGGVTNPVGVTGEFWPASGSLSTLALPVSVTIGGANAQVMYAGSAPTQESGYFQINVQLPASLPASSHLVLTVGGASNPAASATVAIQ